jgi:hypothetical protein
VETPFHDDHGVSLAAYLASKASYAHNAMNAVKLDIPFLAHSGVKVAVNTLTVTQAHRVPVSRQSRALISD